MEGAFLLGMIGAAVGLAFAAAWWAVSVLIGAAFSPNVIVACAVLGAVVVPAGAFVLILKDGLQ